MTAREMQGEFDARLQLAIPSTEVAIKPDSTVIFMHLNEAQDQIVKSKYSGNNPTSTGFERNQIRIDELRVLVREVNLTITVGTPPEKPNSYIAEFPEDYKYLLSDEVTIEGQDFEGVLFTQRCGVTECTANNYRSHVDDPYSEHRYHYETAKPLRLISEDKVELISDGNYVVSFYHLRYLKEPVQIALGATPASESSDCELPSDLHQDVVNLAVNLFLQSVSVQANTQNNQS